ACQRIQGTTPDSSNPIRDGPGGAGTTGTWGIARHLGRSRTHRGRSARCYSDRWI
ncbi:MAG: hypothetical protein AVDCRST_MAG18-4152, partial [uncultured Thermomicrobiales bacterium]